MRLPLVIVCSSAALSACSGRREPAPSTPPAPAPEVATDEGEAHAVAMLAGADDRASDGGRTAMPGRDHAAQLAEVEAAGSATQVGTSGGRGGRVGDPRVGEAGSADARRGELTVVSQRAIDDTSLGASDVVRKVLAAYAAGLRRCYLTALAKSPGLDGRTTLTFTVTEQGRTEADRVKGLTGEMEQCIGPILATWRFAAPRDADGEPATSSFELVLRFSPP